ncbi:MAG: hypothetical protein II184_03970, partial [Clostridia bacterium]|nr:hypothetical protein [Clostridia bacterium]
GPDVAAAFLHARHQFVRRIAVKAQTVVHKIAAEKFALIVVDRGGAESDGFQVARQRICRILL